MKLRFWRRGIENIILFWFSVIRNSITTPEKLDFAHFVQPNTFDLKNTCYWSYMTFHDMYFPVHIGDTFIFYCQGINRYVNLWYCNVFPCLHFITHITKSLFEKQKIGYQNLVKASHSVKKSYCIDSLELSLTYICV